MEYILYTRTSTLKQSLGLDAQRQTAKNFLTLNDTIIREYTEQESGTTGNRPQLIAAIADSKETGAILLIANLSRLSRSVTFTYSLMDAGVNFKCCDMPNANSLTIGLMSVIAQDFATTLSINTKKGIAASKAKGTTWGTNNLTRVGTLNSAANRKAQAKEDNHQATKIILRLRMDGMTFKAIADELNTDGYTTSKGSQYLEQTVSRLYKRAA